jgi:hypothetical protein
MRLPVARRNVIPGTRSGFPWHRWAAHTRNHPEHVSTLSASRSELRLTHTSRHTSRRERNAATRVIRRRQRIGLADGISQDSHSARSYAGSPPARRAIRPLHPTHPVCRTYPATHPAADAAPPGPRKRERTSTRCGHPRSFASIGPLPTCHPKRIPDPRQDPPANHVRSIRPFE